MQEIYKLLIGTAILILGIPVGSLLAKATREELKQGKKWFKRLINLSLIGAVISLILGYDALLFGLLFIAIVTSRSLKKR
jgi:Ca2+-dependent lipid-binding protein